MDKVVLAAGAIPGAVAAAFLYGLVVEDGDRAGLWWGLALSLVATLTLYVAYAWYFSRPNSVQPSTQLTQPINMALSGVVVQDAGTVGVAGRDLTQHITHNHSSQPGAPKRQLLNKSPMFLCGLYGEHVSVQARKLAEPYIGGWIRVSGTVGDCDDYGDGRYLLNLETIDGQKAHYPAVFAVFEGDKWAARLHQLSKKEHVTIEGRIATIQETNLKLHDCDLVE